MAKQKKATAKDARLILELYDLRREAEMRKARNYVAMQFNPQSVDEAMKVMTAFGSDENRWMRQALSYWEMAASLVLRGTINEELFLDCNGEMFFIYAKLKPVLPGLRKAMNSPEFLGQTEKLLHRTAESRKKLKLFEERIAMFTKMRAAAAGEGKQKYGT